MPKGRMLNKKISLDKAVASMTLEAILLYTWTIPHLDVKGRIFGEEEILKGAVVPYIGKYTLPLIKKCVDEWSKTITSDGIPIVLVYGNGQICLQFTGFEKNQRVNEKREAPSDIPDPDPELLKSKSRPTQEQVKTRQVKSKKGNKADESSQQPTEEPKKKFLDCVELTETQHKKLIERFGRARAADWIERLNNYIQSKGKKGQYKSHYHTILNWGHEDPRPKSEAFKVNNRQRDKELAEAREQGGEMPPEVRDEIDKLLRRGKYAPKKGEEEDE